MVRKNCVAAFAVYVSLLAGGVTVFAAQQQRSGVYPDKTSLSAPAINAASMENRVTFVSLSGKKLTAVYDKQGDSVTLTLPDGVTARLHRAISASGTRYTSQRMIFWEHQDEASLWSGEKLIFKGVLARKSDDKSELR